MALTILSLCYALPGNSQYLGGANDGYARSSSIVTLGISPMYYGGTDDGFSMDIAFAQSLAFPQPMFLGGNDDGFSFAAVTSQSLAFPQPMFLGGNDDGFSFAVVTSQSLAFLQPMFLGGTDDGFSFAFAALQPLTSAYMYFGGGGDGQTATISFNTPLPLDYMTISVEWKKNNAHIMWKTIGEFHNDYFNVERSTSGLEFTRISKIEGAKTDKPVDRSYEYDDEEAIKESKEVIYYRVQQVDFDGISTYSSVVALFKNDKSFQWNIYSFPNPVSDEFELNIVGLKTEEKEIQLVDVNGKVIMSQQAASKTKINVREYASGIYFLMVRNGSNVIQTLKIIVTH